MGKKSKGKNRKNKTSQRGLLAAAGAATLAAAGAVGAWLKRRK